MYLIWIQDGFSLDVAVAADNRTSDLVIMHDKGRDAMNSDAVPMVASRDIKRMTVLRQNAWTK